MENNNVKITFAGNPMPLAGKEIKVGDQAPDFVAVGNDLSPVKLSDFKGKTCLISVFPSIDTEVCAAQNRKFNEAASKHDDIAIISISADLPFAQKRFCGTEGIDKTINISDHKDMDFGAKYGFIMQPLRLLARGVVVIDKQGVVKHVEYVPEVTNEPDYAAALKVVEGL